MRVVTAKVKDHFYLSLDRPVVDGRPRYQVTCACGRKTEIGPRGQVEREQKTHRKEMKKRDQ